MGLEEGRGKLTFGLEVKLALVAGSAGAWFGHFVAVCEG